MAAEDVRFETFLQRAGAELERFDQALQTVNRSLNRGGGFGGSAAQGGGGGGPLGGIAGSVGGLKGGAAGLAFSLFDRTVGFAVNATVKAGEDFAKRAAFQSADNFVFSAISDHGVSFRTGVGNAVQESARRVPLLGFVFDRHLAPVDRAVDRTAGQFRAAVRAGVFNDENGKFNKALLEPLVDQQAETKLRQEKNVQDFNEMMKAKGMDLDANQKGAIREDLAKLRDAVKEGIMQGLREGLKYAANNPISVANGSAAGDAIIAGVKQGIQ